MQNEFVVLNQLAVLSWRGMLSNHLSRRINIWKKKFEHEIVICGAYAGFEGLGGGDCQKNSLC